MNKMEYTLHIKEIGQMTTLAASERLIRKLYAKNSLLRNNGYIYNKPTIGPLTSKSDVYIYKVMVKAIQHRNGKGNLPDYIHSSVASAASSLMEDHIIQKVSYEEFIETFEFTDYVMIRIASDTKVLCKLAKIIGTNALPCTIRYNVHTPERYTNLAAGIVFKDERDNKTTSGSVSRIFYLEDVKRERLESKYYTVIEDLLHDAYSGIDKAENICTTTLELIGRMKNYVKTANILTDKVNLHLT